MTVTQPRFEIKLNTQINDCDLAYTEIDENKLFLSQFDGEDKVVYLTINDIQLIMSIDELKSAVDMLYEFKSKR